MANEILKDEIMSDEELDKVAGGYVDELVKDIKFLNAVGIQTPNYSLDYIKNNAREVGCELSKALHFATGTNLTVYGDDEFANDYRIASYDMGEDDTYLTRSEFYQQVCNALGKPGFDYKKYL